MSVREEATTRLNPVPQGFGGTPLPSASQRPRRPLALTLLLWIPILATLVMGVLGAMALWAER